MAEYVVAGATGHVGSVVAQTLMDSGRKVRVIVRDPHKAERFRWLHETTAAWLDASRRCDAVWMELVRDIPEELIDEVEIADPPEQAEVDALWAQLDDVVQKDLWPRHLYWSV